MKRRYCVAVGARRITAIPAGGGPGEERVVEWRLPAGVHADPGTALQDALLTLRDQLGPEEGEVAVTLVVLPPLVETKLLDLPPISAEEAELVVRRDAARHFLRGSRPNVIAVQTFGSSGASRGARGRATPSVLASALPRDLADHLHRAVEATGWELSGIVPGMSAWLTGLGEAGAEPRTALVAVESDTAHVLRLEAGVPVLLRRIGSGPDFEERVLEAAGPGPGRARILAVDSVAAGLQAVLDAAGWSSTTTTRDEAASPSAFAAMHAHRADNELVPPRLAMGRRDRSRRRAVRLGMGGAVLLVLAALLQLWGAGRQLERVRQERARIAPAVAPVIAAADSLAAVQDRLATIESLERDTGGWTLALVELAVILPDDIYLVGLQAAGDTVVLDAVGERAGDAIDALRGAGSFRDVRLEGPIQRDVEGGATARERFTLSALRAERPDAGVAPREAPEAAEAGPVRSESRSRTQQPREEDPT